MSHARPRSIAELAESASASIYFSTAYSLRSWLRAADALRTQAVSHRSRPDDGEVFEREFGCWVKCAKILLELIPTHPQHRDLTSEERAHIRHTGQEALDSLNRMKPLLSSRYESWRAAHPDWDAKKEHDKAEARLRNESDARRAQRERDQSQGPSSAASSSSGGRPHETRGLPAHPAVGRSSGVPPLPSQQQQHYPSQPRYSTSESRPMPPTSTTPAHHHASSVSSASSYQYSGSSASPQYQSSHHPHISYPTLDPQPTHRPYITQPSPPRMSHPPTHHPTYTHPPPPPPPPQQPNHQHQHNHQTRLEPPPTQTRPTSRSPSPSPNPTNPSWPKSLQTLNLPPSVVTSFLKCAAKNTKKKIETCGLLLGTLDLGVFTVRVLLIPVQKGTGDTCETLEEEKVFDFQDKRGLLTLGWIHTHPTQSCFLSSLDLHTHSGYQCMLPEAIAVVCSPLASPSLGIFRLTDPPGLPLIMNCRRKELFHQHPDVEGGIYTGGFGTKDQGYGHVRMREGQGVEVVDLRKK